MLHSNDSAGASLLSVAPLHDSSEALCVDRPRCELCKTRKTGQRLHTSPDAAIGRLRAPSLLLRYMLRPGFVQKTVVRIRELLSRAPQSMSDFRSVTQSVGSGTTVSSYFGGPA